MRTSAEINLISTALAVAQGEIKDATKSKVNPHFKNAYATLGDVWDAIREPLAKNGLAVVQLTSLNQYGLVLNTVLTHKSGQSMQGEYPIQPAKPDPQGMGSAMSYARRYTLMSLMGVAPDDDDGNAASSAPLGGGSSFGFGKQGATGAPTPAAAAPAGANGPTGPTEDAAPLTKVAAPATKPKAGGWTLDYKTPSAFAKTFREKLHKAPDLASYEKLFTDNNDNIMRLLDEDTKQHDSMINAANARKDELTQKGTK